MFVDVWVNIVPRTRNQGRAALRSFEDCGGRGRSPGQPGRGTEGWPKWSRSARSAFLGFERSHHERDAESIGRRPQTYFETARLQRRKQLSERAESRLLCGGSHIEASPRSAERVLQAPCRVA